MRERVVIPITAVVVALAAAVAMPLWAARQQSPSAGAGGSSASPQWSAPRTADGQPDLQGIWSNSTYTPLERPAGFAGREFFTEQEAREFFDAAAKSDFERDPNVHYDPTEYGLDRWQNGALPNLRTSQIVDPPDGRFPPLTPEAKEWLSKQTRERGLTAQSREIYERCVSGYWGRGLLMLAGGGGADSEQHIVQTADHVLMVAQSNFDVRVIPLDGRPHLPSGVRRWFGDARGRWEGETLVVETTNFHPDARFRGLPIKNVRLVERFTRIAPDQLRYQLTAEDPTTWTRPWSAEVVWPRVQGPLFEFACHEMNYGLVNVLRGARESARNPSARRGGRDAD